MSVNLEVKGILARILATENLIVEYKKVETASFNVKTRVLTLPILKNATDDIYDLMAIHEAAHGLWTPSDMSWNKERKIPHSYMNIIEDVRIEKLMKKRYPGTPKTFYRGYKELHDRDFFSIGEKRISDFGFPDRINLYFKIGSFISVDFTEKEQELVDKIAKVETFDDVLDAAELLYKHCKEEKKEQQELTSIRSTSFEVSESNFDDMEDSDDSGEEFNDSCDIKDSNKSGESNSSTDSGDLGDSDEESDDSDDMDEPEVKTMDSMNDAFKSLVDTSGRDSVYIELPELNLSDVIVPNDEIHSLCDSHWAYELEFLKGVDKEFNEFKRSAQREVNYLVKEFECHKAADSYSRAKTSRTGDLDCNKLHSYKFSEDIFRKTTILSKGKNHGLVFVLDWSGSMDNVMKDTVKQLFNLIWFCKKVSIPFEVYAFTSNYRFNDYEKYSYDRKDGTFHIPSRFTLLNLLTSKTKKSTLEVQMKNIYRLAYKHSAYYLSSYSIPHQLELSGTPLNESLITLHQILPKFQKDYKLQKVQCVILTDGEATGGDTYDCLIERSYDSKTYIGTRCILFDNSYLRDRKTGNTYSFPYDSRKITDILLRNLRDKFSDINFIGIRVLESRNTSKFVRQYCGDGILYESTMKTWKKERAFSIKTSEYHSYFGLSSSSLSKDCEFDVSECATKSQIKKAFIGSLKTKKMNKKILNEFVQLIK